MISKEQEFVIEWIKKNKRKTLNPSVKCGYNKGQDSYVTVEYVDEVGAYQIGLHKFEGFDVIITELEFYVNDKWEEVEIDRSEYPPMWHYPQSLDESMKMRMIIKNNKHISLV